MKKTMIINRFNDSSRILAKGVKISNDTRKTGVNNNDLIVGPAGAGKTRGYIIPYILHSEESMVIVDTKGNLCRNYGDHLKHKGYDVKCVDFKDIESTTCGYNPLDYIRVRDGVVNDQDVMALTDAMCPAQDKEEPMWDNSAKMLINALVSFVMEEYDEKDRNLSSVFELYRGAFEANSNGRLRLNEELQRYCAEAPNSTFARKMAQFNALAAADRTIACVLMFINAMIATLDTGTVCRMFSMENRVKFNDFFDHKVALFINVSDNDRSFDGLVNLMYAQAFQTFIKGSDKLPDSRMPIPVRFLLDDFSTGTIIPNFDSIISVIRSREISVSLIIQSFSQLESLYGSHKADTIKDNCGHWVFMGTINAATAAEFAQRFNIQMSTVLNMPLSDAYIITLGSKPQKVEKYNLEEDAVYKRLMSPAPAKKRAPRKKQPEAMPENPAV